VEQLAGRIAVVTGGGTGIGRALVARLAGEGAHVAMCDVSEPNMAESRDLALAGAPDGTRVTTFVADVSDASAMDAFGGHVRTELDTDHVHLVINNAGIGGGGSFVAGPRDDWDKTFAVCWGGVYNGCRTFVPMLVAAEEGWLVNVSSVNGFFASIGQGMPHTAYSAAKFAVKGFSEALINDLRVNAPHVGVSVVMPGHIGTSIVINSAAILGQTADDLTEQDLEGMRRVAAARGVDLSDASDDDLRRFWTMRGEMFRDNAPTSAEQAAGIILDGVKEGRWRILVGDDARVLDQHVRAAPEEAYEPSFLEKQRADGGFTIAGLD
jgi:NAD(P)-dependent dehydrogenase (short-subunit alcohol dehydrogenase family)